MQQVSWRQNIVWEELLSEVHGHGKYITCSSFYHLPWAGGGWYAVVAVDVKFSSDGKRFVRVEGSCDCSLDCKIDHVTVPAEANKLIVVCQDCQHVMYRVSGLVTHEWKLEVPA